MKILVREHLNLVDVAIVSDVFVAAFFVLEQAALAVRAEKALAERKAVLGLVLGVLRFLREQFVVAVCELAFVAVAAISQLYPVLAELCLILCPVDLWQGTSLGISAIGVGALWLLVATRNIRLGAALLSANLVCAKFVALIGQLASNRRL